MGANGATVGVIDGLSDGAFVGANGATVGVVDGS